MKRSAGILLSISSLPSDYGIGCFSKEAYIFADWLKKSGQSYWQILPLCPTSYGDSPYQSFSTFAGNPNYIDLETLISEGLLTKAECREYDFGSEAAKVDYEKLYKNRFPLLKKAFKRSSLSEKIKYKKFIADNSFWLENYALFMAVKEHFGGVAWNEWDSDIRNREQSAMEHYREKLADEIEFHRFLQYEFYVQWDKLKRYINKNNIEIIGDIPIYVAYDSADVWADPQLFRLDCNNIPIAVAGCPPDGFSELGQLWGNPIYDWNYHEKNGYKWWIERLRYCFKLYDIVRIDHFRGFDEYYSIPFGSENAINGSWEKGPGTKLFEAVEKAIGKKKYIAEDLGFVTESVRRLVKSCGFPNMKVLEFAFDSRDTGNSSEYLPHNYNSNCVAYTGTHDNQTLKSWYKTISDDEKQLVREYLCDFYTPDEELNTSLIALIMRSCADIVIIPMQDHLGLDDESRMNTPSTIGNNWKWRMTSDDLSEQLCRKIGNMTRLYSR